MTAIYDLLVIGSGTAAMVAALRVRAAGWSVAVVDHRPYGGTCALRGCDPKKMLISGVEVVDGATRMAGRGVKGDLGIDWAELITFKRTFTDPVPARRQERYAEHGIDTLHGMARFTGPNALQVNGTDVSARHVLIAAGARPARLGIAGEEHLATHETFLAMEQLPRRIVLVGGGYIAAEFAHIAARAGAQVTILQRGDRLLKAFDPDLVEILQEKFRSIGVDVRTATVVEGVEPLGRGYSVRARSAGQPVALEADLVVHAAGRAPDLAALDLAAAGVATCGGRLLLNEFLQSTSNASVYAAGDAAGVGPPLTPVSSHHAKVVAANLLEGNHRRPDYRGVPSVAFTLPPIASVGLSEAEARASGRPFRMKHERTSDWYSARRLAEAVYGYKVLVEQDTDHILGAHLVGPHADEVINLFALAIRHGLTVEDLKSTMFAYPTGASDVGSML